MGRMKPRKQFEAMGTISLWVQNLKQALRNLRSHGWQAGISATGLAVGIVCLTFSLNWLWTETNYDYFVRITRTCIWCSMMIQPI